MNSNGSIINNFSTFKEINRLTYTKGEYYSSFIILSDGRLAIVSNDKNVEIKNISTIKCDITLVGHTAFIEFISQLSNGKILTSSIEDASKIWTLQGDSYTVKKLQLEGYAVRAISNNKIVGWKEDKITVIDSDTFEILNSLKENAYVSNIIELSEEDTIAVRTGNDNLSIWNLKTNQREKTFEVDSDDMKSMIETQNKKLFVGGWGKLTIIDLAKNTIERIIKQTKIHYVDSLIELRDVLF